MLRPPSLRPRILPAGVLMLVALAACEAPTNPSHLSSNPSTMAPGGKHPGRPGGTPIFRDVESSRFARAVVISGIATDDDGAPVADATVEVALYPPPAKVVSAATDGAGFYKIETTKTLHLNEVLFGVINAASPVHERFATYVSFSPPNKPIQLTAHVRLYRIQRITAGESTPVTVSPGDSQCDYHGDNLYCRVVRVIVPGTGRLTVTCAPSPGLGIIRYPQDVVQGEYSVEIGLFAETSRSCLLTTSFQPTGPN